MAEDIISLMTQHENLCIVTLVIFLKYVMEYFWGLECGGCFQLTYWTS